MLRLCAGPLLLLSQVVQAQCPSAPELNDLRSRAEAAQLAAPAQLAQAWTALLQAVRGCADPAQELGVLQARSEALVKRGAVAEGLLATADWLVAAERGTDLELQARIRLQQSKLYNISGDMAAAESSAHKALDLLGTDGPVLDRALAWSELSRLARRQGDYLSALRSEKTALALRQQTPDRSDVWRSTLNIATLYEQVELFDEARKHYQLALREVEQLGNTQGLASALTSNAGFLNDFGSENALQALQYAERADALNSGFGDPVRQGSSQLQMGRAHFGLGHNEQAETAYRNALALAQAATAQALEAHVQFRWGELDLRLGRLDSALRRVEAARVSYEEQGNRHRLIKTYALLEQIQSARGDALAAALAGREHFRLRNDLLGAGASSKLGELLAQYALADVRNLNAELQKENSEAESRLSAEERAAAYLIALIGVLIIALLALSWRHRQSRLLNARLRQQAAEIELRRAEVEARRIELAAAHERLKAQSAQLYQSSITDPLTGLRNRGYGLNALRELLASSKALGLRPVVMMLDIDHFKQINDRYGHAVGDRTLERVAENLLIHAPPDAIVARHGGEEFLFVLRDADVSSGNVQAELIRRRLLELQVEHDAGVIHVSASIGVCHCADLEQSSVQSALRAADRALYLAKSAGRNCVRSA